VELVAISRYIARAGPAAIPRYKAKAGPAVAIFYYTAGRAVLEVLEVVKVLTGHHAHRVESKR